MIFHISHVTRYDYASPASESYMEVRLAPPSNRAQTVLRRGLVITPDARVNRYTDYFGNSVEQFSIIHRHDRLDVQAESEIDTHPVTVPPAALDLTVSEARQIFRSNTLGLFDYLRASPGVQLGRRVYRVANAMFRPGGHFGVAVHGLMDWIHERFAYEPGTTDVETPVEDVLKSRRGVCQDFAHVMIAILRSAEIPARYVCGYIETDGQRAAGERGERHLVGSAESHAWVEVGLPNGDWYALDPTNNIPAGSRHVMVSVGRDFQDVSPTRGVFKGASRTTLQVRVIMRRQQPASATA
jgi:transglutaminase-like putative cysteine protease